ncbi:MAG TPA: hypothetical protein VHX60_14965 [Acidobacteriaceae bacterium]|jgi:hypothetical protein|nr:hypothetical protein [Acidobacteriaceae bacterium]
MNPFRLWFRIVLLLGCFALTTRPALTQAPATPVGTASAVQTATLTFTEAATVASINVLTQGAPNLDFQFASGGSCADGTAYSVGQTCTVNYIFDPTHPGIRYGAVVLYDDESPVNAIATTYIWGTGNGPQVTLSPAVETQSQIGIGFSSGLNGIAMDGSGNVFVAAGDTVEEILAAGGYTTVKSIGSYGAFLGGVFGVSVDGAGNLFVNDSPGFVEGAIKEIMAAGGYTRIVTIAALPTVYENIAVDGSGNLFYANTGGNQVMEMLASDGYTTSKTLGSGFGFPLSVAVDGSDNVFVADRNSGFIKEILAAGGYTTVQEIGSKLSEPSTVAVDGNGNVFVAVNTNLNHYVKEFPAKGGYTTTKVLSNPTTRQHGLAVDAGGDIFLSTRPNTIYSAPEWVSELNYTDQAVNFGGTQVGSTSSDSPVTVTVGNNGNEPLDISGVSYPADFPEKSGVATDCTASTVLAPGATCTLSIDFSPLLSSATGLITPLNEEVNVVDNSLNVTDAVQAVVATSNALFAPPALTAPAPSSTLSGASATFTWSPGSATKFQFRLGKSPGGNGLYGSGPISTDSVTVSNLPTDGTTIYARLYYLLNGTWDPIDYVYHAPTTALISPPPGSVLSGSTVTFSWSSGVATEFQFRLGNYLGGNGLFGSGTTSRTSVTVSNLPTTGKTIYARLYYSVNGVWQSTDYTYTAQ